MPSLSPLNQESTLHSKRILCLHGGGTNARIFRAQCRVLERSLQPTFRLCYAEAPFPSVPGPDVVSVYKEFGPFKAWLRGKADDPNHGPQFVVERIIKSLKSAMIEDDEKGATGEWVGLLGFSQGAKICASLLFAQQLSTNLPCGVGGLPLFHFGVLLAGRGPLVWLTPGIPTPQGLVDASEISTAPADDLLSTFSDNVLRIPTVHLHGLKDPGLPLHRRLLYDCCDLYQTRLLEWEGEHRVPIKTKDVNALVHEILSVAIETRALETRA